MKMSKVALALCAALCMGASLAAAQQMSPVAAGIAAGAQAQAATALAGAVGPAPMVFEDESVRGPPLPPRAPRPGPAGPVPTGPVATGPAPAGPVPVDGPMGPGPEGPPAAPPAPLCECPFPPNGGGYFGRGKELIAGGCSCQNACEFRPGPAGPRPSCATVCECPHGVNVQTYNVKRGPVVSQYNRMSTGFHGL